MPGFPARASVHTVPSAAGTISDPPPGKRLLSVLKPSQGSIPVNLCPTPFLTPNTKLIVPSPGLQSTLHMPLARLPQLPIHISLSQELLSSREHVLYFFETLVLCLTHDRGSLKSIDQLAGG